MLERIAIAILVGIFAFLFGMFLWWTLSGITGFGLSFFFKFSLAIGIVCFFFGLWRPNATIDFLGIAGKKIWSFSTEVLDWFRLLR